MGGRLRFGNLEFGGRRRHFTPVWGAAPGGHEGGDTYPRGFRKTRGHHGPIKRGGKCRTKLRHFRQTVASESILHRSQSRASSRSEERRVGKECVCLRPT